MTTRVRVGRALAAPLFALTWWLPLPLPPIQHRLLAVVVTVICLWVTEAIPIPATAMLIGPALILAGVTDGKTAFAPYADPLLFLFYGAFFIAAAMQRHGLDRRIADAIVGSPLVAGRGARARAAMMLAGMLLSMWISNTATTAMLIPILLGMLAGPSFEQLPAPQQAAARLGGLFSIAYACSVGGMGTLVGTPPNLIVVRMLEEVDVHLGFLQFSMVGLPAALLLSGVIHVFLMRRYPVLGKAQAPYTAVREARPWTRAETMTALCLGLAVAGFVGPPLVNALGWPGGPTLVQVLPPPAVAMAAAGLLFFLRDGEGQALLPWPDALRIDWGLIMLFGGGISLGTQMFESGLAETLGRSFIEVTRVENLWTLTAIAIAFTLMFTEVCSNTATANMVVPLVLGVTAELDLPPAPPVLGVGLAASCAFMMPIATGPNAIAYGTGHIPLSTMVRTGFALNLICGTALFLLLRLLCPLYGWSG